MKKILIICIFLMSVFSAVFASGKNEQKPKNVTVALNMTPTEATYTVLSEIAKKFNTENPGVVVEIVNYGDYENTMKTKMAAQDLPDAWATHGWSVARYSEYLIPLNDRSWFSKISPLIKTTITDSNGKVFVLPFDSDVAGIAFNKDILDAAKVDYTKIKTWDDFKAACEKIKAIGKIPIHIGGNTKDNWTVGNFYDWTAPSFLITNEVSNERAALKNGTFEWNKWKPVAKLLVDFRDAGYLNPDYASGTWDDICRQFGMGEVAFAFFGNNVISEGLKYNPKGNFGFMPVPSAISGDTGTLISGERVTLGVWKDSKVKNEALTFIDYCAKPENLNRIAAANGNPTGLVGSGYESNLGDLAPYFKVVENVRGFPYFDREYLPSGMWDSLCFTGIGLLANSMTLDQAVAKMKNDYNSLR